ncbi:hypothetical protein [Rhodopseudomonas pseudopalustris]|uniref:Uncharacterized protein n=1 Tax=Rhodopseudomonas pseudopalustris TaxID=1513892 RepID=A0A1H8QXA5_9BRAD|nr:hypothetical protein [Rhodopseudomonas pseudopalustris]SEO58795.1 hypothetical protein SAMN05444123_103400 [Rhodopseudomonas pseudopalustris]
MTRLVCECVRQTTIGETPKGPLNKQAQKRKKNTTKDPFEVR